MQTDPIKTENTHSWPHVLVAVWAFARSKSKDDDTIKRIVAKIFAAFWKDELGVSELSLAEDSVIPQAGFEITPGLPRDYLAAAALTGAMGRRAFDPDNPFLSYQQLATWGAGEYGGVDESYRDYFSPKNPERGLCAPLNVLEAWFEKVTVAAKEVLPIDNPAPPAETVSTASSRIQKSLKKRKLGFDVMKHWISDYMLDNKDSPTSLEKELVLLERDYPDYRKPARDPYRKARLAAAKSNNMRWWCRKGPKENSGDNSDCEQENASEENPAVQENPIVDNSAGSKYAELSPKLSAELYSRIRVNK